MRTARIEFEEVVAQDDGGGGRIGNSQVVYSCLVEYEALKSSRLLEANQTRLQQAYKLVMWVTSQYAPKTSSMGRFLGKRFTIQSIAAYDQNFLRSLITISEEANGG